MNTGLDERAKFGNFPFDHFALASWNPTSVEPIQKQWARLVQAYEHMNLVQRRIYYQLAGQRGPDHPHMQLMYDNVFCQLVTPKERNLNVPTTGGLHTVWLRTCYDASLGPAYLTMKMAADVACSNDLDLKVFDDSNRYNFDDGHPWSWRRIFLRAPGLTDFTHLASRRCPPSVFEMFTDGKRCRVVNTSHGAQPQGSDIRWVEWEAQVGIFLLDREAMELGIIKLLWLNEHGYPIWYHRVNPYNVKMSDINQALAKPISLQELGGGATIPGSFVVLPSGAP